MMIDRIADDKPLTKIDLARQQGISISSLYYKPLKPNKDEFLKNQIEHVLPQHPSYGHRRIAIKLRVNKKKIHRVMRLFDIKPYRRRGRRFRKIKDYSIIYPNLIQSMPFPEKANQIWVSDFTYIPFHSKYVYLATILDIFNRKIVGWSLLTTHSVQLTIIALIDAIEKHGRPDILHSDQGSEYKAKLYTLPWSECNISGLPCFSMASIKAIIVSWTEWVVSKLQPTILRLNISRIVAR